MRQPNDPRLLGLGVPAFQQRDIARPRFPSVVVAHFACEQGVCVRPLCVGQLVAACLFACIIAWGGYLLERP